LRPNSMTTKTKALLFNLGTVLCWALAPLGIRYVKDAFPVNFQNFFRYLVSLFLIWPILLLSTDNAQLRRNVRLLPSILGKLLIIAGVNYLFQISFTYSFYLLYPAFGTLLYKSGALSAVLMAAVFFADERHTLKQPLFLVGLVLALGGMLLTIVADQDFGQVQFNLGVFVILSAAALWSFLTVLIKKWLTALPIAFALAVILTIVTPLFLLTHVVTSGGLRVPAASPAQWAVMLVFGLLGVGVAHSLYYHSVPVLGVALSSILDLLRPFLVGVLSVIVFAESMTVWQVIGGLVLLLGGYIVITVRFRHI
jgi:drug/metabolite transporter (DMT)-like permease